MACTLRFTVLATVCLSHVVPGSACDSRLRFVGGWISMNPFLLQPQVQEVMLPRGQGHGLFGGPGPLQPQNPRCHHCWGGPGRQHGWHPAASRRMLPGWERAQAGVVGTSAVVSRSPWPQVHRVPMRMPQPHESSRRLLSVPSAPTSRALTSPGLSAALQGVGGTISTSQVRRQPARWKVAGSGFMSRAVSLQPPRRALPGCFAALQSCGDASSFFSFS